MICEVGRLVRDGDYRVVLTTAGAERKVYSNAIAFYTGDKEDTIVDIEAWGAKAEFLNKHFSKGAALTVSGLLRKKTWQNSEGENRTKLYILVSEVFFVPGSGKSSSSERSSEDNAAVKAYQEALASSDTDVPY